MLRVDSSLSKIAGFLPAIGDVRVVRLADARPSQQAISSSCLAPCRRVSAGCLPSRDQRPDVRNSGIVRRSAKTSPEMTCQRVLPAARHGHDSMTGRAEPSAKCATGLASMDPLLPALQGSPGSPCRGSHQGTAGLRCRSAGRRPTAAPRSDTGRGMSGSGRPPGQ